MAISNSLAIRQGMSVLAQAALDSEKGIKVEVPTRGAAVALRARFHKMRQVDRKFNQKLYPADSPLHGSSVWDSLETVIGEENGQHYFILRTLEQTFQTYKITDIATESKVELSND